jgi:hypothetical protein
MILLCIIVVVVSVILLIISRLIEIYELVNVCKYLGIIIITIFGVYFMLCALGLLGTLICFPSYDINTGCPHHFKLENNITIESEYYCTNGHINKSALWCSTVAPEIIFGRCVAIGILQLTVILLSAILLTMTGLTIYYFTKKYYVMERIRSSLMKEKTENIQEDILEELPLIR